MSEGLIRGILKNYTAKLDKQYSFETPEILGIDEVHLNREMRLVLTNITERTIVDMVDNRSKKTVVSALHRFKDMKKIKIVTMDMWRPYRDAVYGSIPGVIIVIDKFHIVKMANEAVEKGRKDIKSQLTKEQALRLKKDRWLMLKRKRDLTPMQECMLDGWIENYPELHALHTAKEGFCDIWDQHYTRVQAESAFDAWIASISPSVYKYFEVMIKSVSNWHKESFNYFDHRVTNAYTESANNHIKSIAKQGRGYSFEVLRARVLFVGAKHKIKQKPFKTSIVAGEKVLGFMIREDSYQNFGVVFPHEANNS